MNRRGVSTIIAGLGLVVAVVAAARTPFFPGDVAAARWIQSLLPAGPFWAPAVTQTAVPPWSLLLPAATFLLCRWIAGWKVAILSILSFLGMWLMGSALKAWIFRPRPSPELIQVIGSISGSSFPSTFALTYGSTVGFLLWVALRWGKGAQRAILAPAALFALLLGGSARVILGAHWPSDVLISYALSLFWAGVLIQLLDVKPRGKR